MRLLGMTEYQDIKRTVIARVMRTLPRWGKGLEDVCKENTKEGYGNYTKTYISFDSK